MAGKQRYSEELKSRIIEALVANKSIRQIRQELKKQGIECIPDRHTIDIWAKQKKVAAIRKKLTEAEETKLIRQELSRRDKQDRIISKLEYELVKALDKGKLKVKFTDVSEGWKFQRLRDGESTENIDNRIEFKLTRLPPKDGNKPSASPLPS